MNRNLITPRVNEFIIKNSPVWAELTKKASTIAKLLRDDAIAADGNGVKLLGFVYSNSLYEDGTDNIFYQVYGGRTENQKEGFIEIKFVHNATQLFTGLIVSPHDVQVHGQPTAYAAQALTNVVFPRILTHLLYLAMEKLSGELAGGTYANLAQVALLKDV